MAQVYVRDSHEGIIDKETWEAVQLEFERRERFKTEHGLKTYGYGSGCNPFSGRVFCGNCGNLYTKHSWKSRGVEQWQCRNHITNGKVTCINGFVKNEDLESGFVKAYNILMSDREKNFPEWERLQAEWNPLERLRAGQFLKLAGEPPLTVFVPELAELVIYEVSILSENEYEFVFTEGNRKVVKI